MNVGVQFLVAKMASFRIAISVPEREGLVKKATNYEIFGKSNSKAMTFAGLWDLVAFDQSETIPNL